MKIRVLFAALSIVIALCGSQGCARNMPPSLSAPAQTAWKQHEAQKDLDVVRDIAQDAQGLGVISVNSARAITIWHRSAITLIHDAPNGWRRLALTSIDELQHDLPPPDYDRIARYLALVKLAIQEIP